MFPSAVHPFVSSSRTPVASVCGVVILFRRDACRGERLDPLCRHDLVLLRRGMGSFMRFSDPIWYTA
ncbi:unnamed protein product, partial [Ectocarpus sp. 12 AP-2014]